jgi:hypothetical protein
LQDGADGDAGNGNGSKRRLPGNRADRGCVASWGQDHLAGNGADFLLVLTLEEPMHEAKQMTTGQPVGRITVQVDSLIGTCPVCAYQALSYWTGTEAVTNSYPLLVSWLTRCDSRLTIVVS